MKRFEIMITKTLSLATAALAFCQSLSSVVAGPVGGDADGFQGAMKKDAESFVFNRYTMTMSASKIEDPDFW